MKIPLLWIAGLFTCQPLLGQMPEIKAVQIVDTLVLQYGKFEAMVDLTASYTNPYDYEEISVSAVFLAPDGQEKRVDGFYMLNYELDTANGNLTPSNHPGQFKIRFSPDQVGQWGFRVAVADSKGRAEFPQLAFSCVASDNVLNQGFVRSNLTNYLHFDSGDQYIPVGENIAWQNNNPYLDYRAWLTSLSENGGNFFRLWQAHWGLGIEWKNGSNGFQGLRRYKETNSWYQDWLFDFCAEKGIYAMLCIQHHGQVSSQVNPNWSDSPYNAVNGGPCQHTWDFFTNEEARAHTKNRLRYIVARWGYARSIMAWELFNEVEWTDNFAAHQAEVANWHAEMAAYLKEIDPYQHLVTTSFAQEKYDPVVWANPDIDLTQTHYYINTSNIERALANVVRQYLDDFGKPTLTGEFGLGPSASLANQDPDGVHIHNALWGALFGGGLGSAMTWWWDSYIHPRDLYYHFAPVSAVARDIPFLTRDMRPAISFVTGAPGDLTLIPTLGWGSSGEANIAILENGQINPANVGLGTYLYGSQWNTQYRSPPSFTITYPADGTFAVRTNTQSGTAPKIAIYLDGNKVLETGAAVNQTYSIPVAAGQHTIQVDNTGTDWISISSYTFSGAGSKVDSYALISENKDLAAGWVLNNQYNHEYIARQGQPDPVSTGQMILEGFQDGVYTVFWYDCLSGDLVSSDPAFATAGKLTLLIPELYWDFAFLVEGNPVATKEIKRKAEFEVYPNPVLAGAPVQISHRSAETTSVRLSLLDAAGRVLQERHYSNLPFTQQPLEFNLDQGLPAGLYWVRYESEGRSGAKPVMVGRE